MKNWRINLVLVLVIIFGATIICRLAYIQILKGDFYRALAKGQQGLSYSIKPDRGEIFATDKDGGLYILATNKDSRFVFLSSGEIRNKEELTQNLSETLELEKSLIQEKLEQKNSFIVVKKDLTGEEIRKIEESEIDGVHMGTEITRNYPEKNLAAHVLGFVGGEGSGQYGVEGFYEEELKGKEGFAIGEKSSDGYMVFFDSENSLSAQKGSDLVLTIDLYIQFKAEELLKKAKEDFDVKNGQIIVLDPGSGEIIASASLENFDPNEYYNYDLSSFINPVSQKLFEPGSVFKTVSMATAIEERKVTPQTTYIDEGFVKIGPDTIYNYSKRVYGEQTMTEVLEKSINTGAVFAEETVSHDVFLDYIDNFGVFEKTEIDTQGEVFSQNKELKEGYEINFATASFGQGIEMTPMQLVRVFSVFANGGKLIKPHVVKEIIGLNGSVLNNNHEEISVISNTTASKLTAMLVSVVENGFSKKAGIPGYYIAGKTGTAQVPWSVLGINKSGYSDETIQTFVGFAPAFNPEFLIMVKLDNPNTKTAEYSTIPLFKELAEYIINYYQIPPDHEE